MTNILNFGAVADGKTLCTKAIQNAVDSLSDNGGVIYIPYGTYVCSTIHLKSNIHFVFEPGAKLLGSTNVDDFDKRETVTYKTYQDASHTYFNRSMFVAKNCENISFTGLGTIDMQGIWENENTPGEGEWCGKRAVKIFAFKECKNIVIKDMTLLKATDIALYLAGCENVKLSGLNIDTNIDGISPDCCKNVIISDCSIRSGDDAIVLKASYTLNRKADCENITVANCNITTRSNAIKIGTETNGDFRNISVNNCTLSDVFYGGISVESADGGNVDGVTVSNITMQNVGYPLFIILNNRARGPEDTTIGSIKNVIIDNITATGPYKEWLAPKMTALWDGEQMCKSYVMPSTVTGQPDKKLENISLSNFYFTLPGGCKENYKDKKVPEITKSYPENYEFGNEIPACGIYFRHIKNLSLSNINIDTIEKDERDSIFFEDTENK